jgi:hypothetical protein
MRILGLLRRHVIRRANDGILRRQPIATLDGENGEAEVENLDLRGEGRGARDERGKGRRVRDEGR